MKKWLALLVLVVAIFGPAFACPREDWDPNLPSAPSKPLDTGHKVLERTLRNHSNKR